MRLHLRRLMNFRSAEPWKLPASSSSTRTAVAPAYVFESPQEKNLGNKRIEKVVLAYKARSSVWLPNFSHTIALDESRDRCWTFFFGRGLFRDQTESAMNDAPHAYETVKDLDIGKEEVSGQTDAWDTIPETIQELLRNPPLLDHENEEEFLKLFESFRAYAQPEDIVDYHLVYNATVCKWETNRYRRMAMAVTSNQQQAGLKSLFMQTHREALLPIAEKMVEIEAARNARRCLTDPEYREEAYMDLESMGYIPDGQAFLLSLPALATIERLSASAEKRYAASIKELDKRCADRTAKRRLALAQAINEDLKKADKA
jgi:hypothetical protein